MALQLTGTNGIAPRALTSWIARATSSLPVPDSPATSTGAMLRATFSTSSRTFCIAIDWPAMRAERGAHRRRRRRRGGARRPRRRGDAMLRRQAGRIDRRRAAAAAAERRGDDAAELLQVDRLGQVVVGAGLERVDGVLGRAVGGDDDRLLAPVALLEPLQHVEAGAVGQAHVGDDGAVGAILQMQQRLLHGAGGVEVVAFAQQRQLVERAQVGLVVDDEQAEVRGGGHRVMAERSTGSRAARRMSTKNSLRSASPGGSSR